MFYNALLSGMSHLTAFFFPSILQVKEYCNNEKFHIRTLILISLSLRYCTCVFTYRANYSNKEKLIYVSEFCCIMIVNSKYTQRDAKRNY